MNIKTPQLYGIIAGCIVFVITIIVVFYLLYASGALSGFIREISNTVDSANAVKDSSLKEIRTNLMLHCPMLYDDLIKASKSLPLQPNPPNMNVNILFVIEFMAPC